MADKADGTHRRTAPNGKSATSSAANNDGMAKSNGFEAQVNGEQQNDKEEQWAMAKAVAQTTASEWLLILSLIFGGCCSNAYTLELATRQLPSAGTLITFAQFFVTTISCVPHFVTFTPLPTLKQRNVPLYRWIVQVAFYFSTSLLNNMAFAYDVPMPVHIVFRSGGLVINMILGYLVQKHTYTKLQVLSVLLVTVGVIASTLDSASAAAPTSPSEPEVSAATYLTGVLYLFSALVLTGFMGVWQEKTFKLYGNQNWRESLFYSHLLSLPMFAIRGKTLWADVLEANTTTKWWFGWGVPLIPAPTAKKGLSGLLQGLVRRQRPVPVRLFDLSRLTPHSVRQSIRLDPSGFWVPSFYPPLLLNVATQLLCINGVNRLTSKVSSLSVTLVLVVRKALSLFISVMIVSGSSGSLSLWLGAAAVLLGTIGYSISKPAASPAKTKTS
ncbi:UAA transporter [Testicularia cyperi]|uniref:UAA transporter n=1 Tax=Testicularia cyperi TaxID=1882483 RepID=A0A317XS32_9BASI|nr:UAA transporter [Testicularia cyperi]